jgi:hypothetical protein
MIKPIEKIAICTALINFYESDNEKKFIFGMCAIIKKLVEMQCKEDKKYYKGLLLEFPEFCRHEKYSEPVLWWAPFDFKSRINYLHETIEIVKANEILKKQKVEKLLLQASQDKNFLKVYQAKKILTEINQNYEQLQNH